MPKVHVTLSLLLLVGIPSCRFGYEVFNKDHTSDEGSSDGGAGSMSADGGALGTGGQELGGSGGSVLQFGGMGGVPAAGGAGTGGTSFGEAPYCERIHMLPVAPTIDGERELQLPTQTVAAEGTRVPEGNPSEHQSIPPNVSMAYAVAWRPDGLYFYAEVVDSDYNPAPDAEAEWAGDGVELYVDHDAVFAAAGTYDDQGTYSFIVEGPPDLGMSGAGAGYYRPYTRQDDWAGQWISKSTDDGYVIEAFIDASDLGLSSWTISDGSQLAFDLGHNVSFPVGVTGPDVNRLGQYFLQAAEPLTSTESDYPFFNSSVFCTPEVVEN